MEKNGQGSAPRPSVGVGVLVQNDKGEILFGLRQGSFGSGKWVFPGGHIEFGETIFEAARREVMEETGLSVDKLSLISVGDDLRYIESDGKHYFALGVLARDISGEPKVMEPERCLEWRWFKRDHLPDKILGGSALTLRNYLAGTVYQEGMV